MISMVMILAGCIGGGGSYDTDAGPRKAFHDWVEIMELGDFAGMWNRLPMTGKERFHSAWEEEKANLAKSSEDFKTGFMKRYGFSSWADVKTEDAASFFVRSMGVCDDGKTPQKYKILKKSTVHEFKYLSNGNSCVLTFKSADGVVLPLKMKLQKEGDMWQVIRMP